MSLPAGDIGGESVTVTLDLDEAVDTELGDRFSEVDLPVGGANISYKNNQRSTHSTWINILNHKKKERVSRLLFSYLIIVIKNIFVLHFHPCQNKYNNIFPEQVTTNGSSKAKTKYS